MPPGAWWASGDFTDVDAILVAWHERQIGAHLDQLRARRARPGAPLERPVAVLEAYPTNAHRSDHHGAELSAMLHGGERVQHAQAQLVHLVRDLLVDAADVGEVRTDVPPDELAVYCVHALAAAGRLGSGAAIRRLVSVTEAGLEPR